MTASRPRLILIVTIQLLVAAVHVFRLGHLLEGDPYRWYSSYFSDIALPFAVYFLLAIRENQFRLLRFWYVKAGLVFGIATTAEILQAFGVYALGRTFDYFDILAYATGVLLAAFTDRLLFARFFSFWDRT